MVRIVDTGSRKKAVLAATINRYIKNAVPVSSEDIAREFSLSSATIRNIFAELEEDGYLTHPYTSGGRVPTNKGYRYYVDFLVSEMEMLEGEKESIIREYQKKIMRLEDVLERTSEVTSAITHYASIVSFLQWEDRFFYRGISFILDEPEFRDSTRIKLLIKMIEDKRTLLNIINRELEDDRTRIYIGDELGCGGMDNCSLVVSTYRFKDKPIGKVAVLGPVRMEYRHTIPVVEYVSEVLTGILAEQGLF